MEKKYGFTGATMEINGQTFHEIIALKDFGNVGAGEVGGYIASEKCLSQQGDCWVDKDSIVRSGSAISGNAMIINSHITNSNVYGKAVVKDAFIVSCEVKTNAYVCGGDFFGGIFGRDANINGEEDYLSVKGLGTENRLTTAYKTADGGVRISCGCFNGNVKEFRYQVNRTRHGKIFEEYLMFADLVEKYFGIEEKKSEPEVYKNKFKVGEKVRILDGSKIENYFGKWDYQSEGVYKCKFVGMIGTVYDVLGDMPGVWLKEFDGFAFDSRALEIAEPKFKPGDLVRILDGSDIYKYSGSFIGKMREHVGKIARISGIDESYSDKYAYRLLGNSCVWDERGLEKVEEDEIEPLNDVFFEVKSNKTEFHESKTYWICRGKIVNTDDKVQLPLDSMFYTKEDVLEYFEKADARQLENGDFSHFCYEGIEIEFVEPEPLNCEIMITKSESTSFAEGEVHKIVDGFMDGNMSRQKLYLPEQLEEYFKTSSEGRLVEGNKCFTHWSDGHKVELEIIEKKPLNTKFVVLEASGSSLAKGKIYKVVNGKFKDDSGEMFPYNSKLYSYKDLENYFDPSIKYMGHYYIGVTKIMEIVE